MASARVEIFRQMLEQDPLNASILFGLAKEYEKAGQYEELVKTLGDYLSAADDEGNAYGMLAGAYRKLGRHDQARAAYENGIKVAQSHGHPSMAEDFRMTLMDYED